MTFLFVKYSSPFIRRIYRQPRMKYRNVKIRKSGDEKFETIQISP